MKLIAINTINRGGKLGSVAPGADFDASDDEGKALIAAGAAVRKTKQVADDGPDEKQPLVDVIALASQQGVTLQVFKKAAAHHLTTVPDKKEEIVAALKALPPEAPKQ